VLGELYKPTGLAREHAQQVLEVKCPYAVNVAWGCPHGCPMCYGFRVGRQSFESWMKIRYPQLKPVDLVRKQLSKGLKPEGVFLCFETDPFATRRNRQSTEEVIGLLLNRGIKVATSSKVGVSRYSGVRHGMTIISLDKKFCEIYEPRVPLSPQGRISLLRRKHKEGEFTWVSLEPCPPPTIWKQDIRRLLEEISFVDLIVKGAWRYDRRAKLKRAKEYYKETFKLVLDFCKEHGIKCHIKTSH